MIGGDAPRADRDRAAGAPPWLSVVMPAFNGARFIRRALDSVVAADRAGVECVVVDDGSSDGTPDIVERYRPVLRLRTEHGPRAGNWVAATNAGIEAASGRYVTFLHQDDVWLPGRLDAVLELIRRPGRPALYVHAARFLSEHGGPLGRWSLPLPGSTGVVEGAAFVERLLVQNFLSVGAPVFRREDVLSSGGLDETLWYTADWDLWLRLASTGPVAYDARPLVGFRIHPHSQTSTRSADLADFRRQLEGVFDDHFRRWASARPAADARSVERASRASIELNVALAAMSHGTVPPLRPVGAALASLGARGAGRVARDSRLHQRLGARLRAGAAELPRRIRLRSTG